MKLTKLTSWFSDQESEETSPKVDQQPSENPELLRLTSRLEKLTKDLQLSQKELAQVKAQLQINQGFQIELGEVQLQLNLVRAELEKNKRELAEQQRLSNAAQSQLRITKKQLAESQDWLNQLETEIQIVDIKKTLLKQDFETLWGFSIISPKAETTIKNGALVVKGWVLGKKSSAQSVVVKYQNKLLLEVPVNLRRPLVMQQYPDIPSAGTSGFEFAVSVAGMPRTVNLSMEAILADQTYIPLCEFILLSESNESNVT